MGPNLPVPWWPFHKLCICTEHDDVIQWKHFPRYWPFVRGIHRSPVNSPHKGRWRGAFMFSFICAWINGWVNNREADYLRPHHAHYGVTGKGLQIYVPLRKFQRMNLSYTVVNPLRAPIVCRINLFQVQVQSLSSSSWNVGLNATSWARRRLDFTQHARF